MAMLIRFTDNKAPSAPEIPYPKKININAKDNFNMLPRMETPLNQKNCSSPWMPPENTARIQVEETKSAKIYPEESEGIFNALIMKFAATKKIKRLARARIEVFLKRSDSKNFIFCIWLCALNSAAYLVIPICRVLKGKAKMVNSESKELNAAKSAGENLWAMNN